ncbi:ABC transporter ATP-binding protein [Pseudoalteromonas phenolica]|uniref:ABC transporter ATP-binding protein n=1 Tax=Pseudoalteromonas phenolica TaxID=161398 RepID=UPI00110A6E80|nr:ABC transporter ATP-binding protein [Pseudoalteromonas phenolica]TMO56191.1 ABC transporter [Pseudoalteromonas phenolica]
MQSACQHSKFALQVSNLDLVLDKHQILHNISFDVAEGQFIGLLGPNGAGKSSLLRCLYRFFTLSSGQITLFNKTISSFSHNEYAQQVAVVLQEMPEHFNLSLYDVVAMGITPHKSLFSPLNKADHELIAKSIEQVGLTHKINESFAHLSGGEKQRALIAKAMAQKPRLLIMDEPTSHLDVKYQIQIMELAKAMGITVVASFHDLNLAAAMSDSLLVLQHGELYKRGTPTDVLDAQLLSDVFDVCAEVTQVPCPYRDKTHIPHIRYHFGYQL